jgi:hypothetical protein
MLHQAHSLKTSGIIKRMRSYSLDSAVELSFRNRSADDYVFESTHRDVASRIELSWTLSVDVAKSLLLLVVGKLYRERNTHF